MAKNLSAENITRIPVVEVTSPSGNVEFWVVASPHDEAKGIVQKHVPPDHAVRYVGVLLPGVKLKRRSWLYPGEAWRLEQ